ncbi:hypothetical protein LCGC14_0644140 [marine sediment metagenome]|uniref:Terminase large subunit gp17-like C-terminal domain-containing protein n=1 Tax=marine sediment metagenome TaxID=412755 RepID=A0A0F9QYH3_9ZZZZ
MATRQQASRREQERIRLSDPFTDEEWAIIKAAQKDFWIFLTTVYAASFKGEAFLYSDGSFGPFALGRVHHMWADKIGGRQYKDTDGDKKGPYSRWRIMAPRLHLKSTVLGRGYIFWRFFSEGQDVDAFYFDYKKPLAEEHVTILKRDIEKNPFCRFWTDNNPTATSIIDFTVAFRESARKVPEGTSDAERKNIPLEDLMWRVECEAEGILAATRGRHPKIVICDDILSDFANPAESVEIQRINDIFERTIMSLPPPDGTLGVVGTPQSPYDILHRLQKNDLFYCGIFPAVKDYAKEDVLWPEMFDFKRLMALKRSITPAAFEVEYQLHPRESVDQFLDTEAIEACLDNALTRFVPREGETWENPEKMNVWGGMDVGKEVHPSHVVFHVEMPPEPGEGDMGWLLQIYEEWLDGMKYNEQVTMLNELIRYFNPVRFYFDSTRSELEDRGLTKRATGIKFARANKASMATLLQKRITNSWYHYSGEGADPSAGPGIIMYGPEDSRQVRSLKQVKKDLSASENEDGHGDAFFSNALAVYALESGPRITNLGSAQDIFGGRRTGGGMHMLDCTPEFKTYEVPDPLGLAPPKKFRKCENCGFTEDV